MHADTWYEAVRARDARFDGVFFTGVSTTGIYCRAICPAPLPRRDRCRFFRSAAEAERHGFRACLRCRPELAPGAAPVDARRRLAASAIRRIDEGVESIAALAREVGVSERHLRRVVASEVGASPVELAQTRRVGLAKRLLHDTALPVTEVAFASGFASVRRFNAVFRARFGRPPTALRRERHGEGAGDPTARGAVLRLDYRPPLDWTALLAFLGDRAVPGLEAVADGVYRRALRVGGAAGWVAVRPDPARTALVADASLSLVPALLPLVAKLRALFDLDAQPRAIDALLAKDARLARSVGRRPGLRLPGAVDGLEIAVRAVLGQQVSVRAATTLASRLVAAFGARLALPREERVRCGVDRLFPTADALADAGARRIARLGIVGARARSIEALARAAADGRLSLTPDAPVDATIDALRAMPGIGPWTASYVAMRALAWPDALVAGDLALRRALGARDAREVERRAERWRPWRAYGVMHVWSEARGDA